MCHSRTLNTKINKIHKRALRIVFNDNNSLFDALIQKAGTVKIHHRNLQILAVEIYKALYNYSSILMSELFKLKDIDPCKICKLTTPFPWHDQLLKQILTTSCLQDKASEGSSK